MEAMGPNIRTVVVSVREGENYTATVMWHLGNFNTLLISQIPKFFILYIYIYIYIYVYIILKFICMQISQNP